MSTPSLHGVALPVLVRRNFGRQEAAEIDVVAYDFESYSTRACRCGAGMRAVRRTEAERARWQCPNCGRQKRR